MLAGGFRLRHWFHASVPFLGLIAIWKVHSASWSSLTVRRDRRPDRLPSREDPALQLSVCGGVQWCHFRTSLLLLQGNKFPLHPSINPLCGFTDAWRLQSEQASQLFSVCVLRVVCAEMRLVDSFYWNETDSEGSYNQNMFLPYLLNRWTLCNQTRYGDVSKLSFWARAPAKRLSIFMVKVTVRACTVMFLPYLLNCWTFCNQTQYGDVSSWARVLSKRLVCYLHGHCHSEDSHNQNMFLP